MAGASGESRFARLAAALALGAAAGLGAARAIAMARAGRATVLYDGGCPLCRAAVARLRRWDTRNRLEYQDARDTESLAARFPRLPPDPQLREMRVVLDDGRVLGGFDAVRAIAALLPRFRLVAPLLFLPGIRPVGAAVYRCVAARRPQDACNDAVCGLHAGKG